MRTRDIGKYYLFVENNRKIELKNQNNIIAYDKDILFHIDDDTSVKNYESVYCVRFVENSIEISNIYDRNDYNQQIQSVKCEQFFVLGKQNCKVSFECDTNNLEFAIKAFKKGSLIGAYSLSDLLLCYAKKIELSDKKALIKIITSIDIPEIDIPKTNP